MMSILGKERIKHHARSFRELGIINEIALLAGLMLMTIGTFMGAVWANESWGRYWGWDPKETWALITIVVYTMVTHLHLLPQWYNLWSLNLCSVIAFASVLMTYFGVNYFLRPLYLSVYHSRYSSRTDCHRTERTVPENESHKTQLI